MSLFGAIAPAVKSANGLSWGELNTLWSGLFGGYARSRSGTSVSWQTSLAVSTIVAGARALAEGIAQMPLQVLRVGADRSRKPATDHPAYKLLNSRPNDLQTSFEMRESLMLHAVLAGNAYVFINRVAIGTPDERIVELIPISPDRCEPLYNPDWSIYRYRIHGRDNQVAEVDPSWIWHIRGLSWDGYRGLDMVKLAREAIGLSMAAEQSQALLHANAARPSGLISVPKNIGQDELIKLAAWVKRNYAGLDNTSRVMVLDNDAKFTPFDFKGVDNQQLEMRRMQIEEVCRFLRVFPQMVMHTDKTATFASADAFFTAHVVHSLSPWMVRIEQSAEHRLLGNDDTLIVKFDVKGLLRGDATTRSSYYEKALGGARGETAFMTRNEVRALEDLDPIEGGDELPLPPPPPVPPPGFGGDPAAKALIDILLKSYNAGQSRDDHGRWAGAAAATAVALLKSTSAREAIATLVSSPLATQAVTVALTGLIAHVGQFSDPISDDVIATHVENVATNLAVTKAKAKSVLRQAAERLKQVHIAGKAAEEDPVGKLLDQVIAALDAYEGA
jgi:HK97 family phage portal protein